MKALKNNRGDTIVEVLISIAVVGAVITGAYALASHSLQEGIAASEHTAAIKLAQAQVESLKFRQKASTPDTWKNFFTKTSTTQNFCLDTAATSETDASGNVLSSWKPQINGNAAFDPTVLQAGATNYKDNAAHTLCVRDNGKYFINIMIPTAPSDNPTYQVMVRWNPVGSSVQNQTTLYYRF